MGHNAPLSKCILIPLIGIRKDNLWNIRIFLHKLTAFIVDESEPLLEWFVGGIVVYNDVVYSRVQTLKSL